MKQVKLKRYHVPPLAVLQDAFLEQLEKTRNPGRGNLQKIRSMLLGHKSPSELFPGDYYEWNHDAEIRVMNYLLDGHGVESCACSPERVTDNGLRFCPTFSYVNMGDPYVTTILRDHKQGKWIVASYGEVVEEWERLHSKED